MKSQTFSVGANVSCPSLLLTKLSLLKWLLVLNGIRGRKRVCRVYTLHGTKRKMDRRKISRCFDSTLGKSRGLIRQKCGILCGLTLTHNRTFKDFASLVPLLKGRGSHKVPPGGCYIIKWLICLGTKILVLFSSSKVPLLFQEQRKQMEDGWSVETAQSNVSSNVQTIVDITERGKCQLSQGMREK